MSRARKQKRDANAWHCLQCGERMHRELSEPALKVAKATYPEAVQKWVKIVHLCGACKTIHLETDDSHLRLPTTAERFKIEMQQGQNLRRMEAMTPSSESEPTGTMIL